MWTLVSEESLVHTPCTIDIDFLSRGEHDNQVKRFRNIWTKYKQKYERFPLAPELNVRFKLVFIFGFVFPKILNYIGLN